MGLYQRDAIRNDPSPSTGTGLVFDNSEPDRLNRLSLAFADWVVDRC